MAVYFILNNLLIVYILYIQKDTLMEVDDDGQDAVIGL